MNYFSFLAPLDWKYWKFRIRTKFFFKRKTLKSWVQLSYFLKLFNSPVLKFGLHLHVIGLFCPSDWLLIRISNWSIWVIFFAINFNTIRTDPTIVSTVTFLAFSNQRNTLHLFQLSFFCWNLISKFFYIWLHLLLEQPPFNVARSHHFPLDHYKVRNRFFYFEFLIEEDSILIWILQTPGILKLNYFRTVCSITCHFFLFTSVNVNV